MKPVSVEVEVETKEDKSESVEMVYDTLSSMIYKISCMDGAEKQEAMLMKLIKFLGMCDNVKDIAVKLAKIDMAKKLAKIDASIDDMSKDYEDGDSGSKGKGGDYNMEKEAGDIGEALGLV